MKGFLQLCGIFLLSCFANEAAMAQSTGVLDPYDTSTSAKSKKDDVGMMVDSNTEGQAEEGYAFNPEKNGYIKTEENGKVIFVKKTGKLNFRYEPQK